MHLTPHLCFPLFMGALLAVRLKAQGPKNSLDILTSERSMLAPHKLPTPAESGENEKDVGSRAGCLRLHGEAEAAFQDGTVANHAMVPGA